MIFSMLVELEVYISIKNLYSWASIFQHLVKQQLLGSLKSQNQRIRKITREKATKRKGAPSINPISAGNNHPPYSTPNIMKKN